LATGLGQYPCQLLRLLHRCLDLVEAEEVGDLFDVVDDVVQGGGELEDVLTVDRGDERVVGGVDHVVRDPVTLLLTYQYLAREVPPFGVVAQHLVEQIGGPDDVATGLFEQIEELPTAWREDL